MRNKTRNILLFVLLLFMLSIQGCESNTQTNRIVVYNTDTLKTSVNMIQPDGNLTFIKATINGKEVTFLLDSGAGSTVLDKDQLYAHNLDYKSAGSEFQGVGGSNELYIVTNLDKISIEGREFSVNCKASNLSNVVSLIKDASGIEIVGILGSDFFTEHKVIFDYNEKLFFISEN